MTDEIKQNAEKAVPEAILHLNGKAHTIKCSFGVLVRYQRITGKDALKKDTFNNMMIDDYVALMAACMYPTKEDPAENHLDEVAEQMQSASFKELATVVVKIFTNAAPAVDESEKKTEQLTSTDATSTKTNLL